MTANRLTTAELARTLKIDCSPSNLVTLDERALATVADHVGRHTDFANFRRYTWDNPQFWYPEASQRDRSQYFAIGNAINFRFWRLSQGQIHSAGGSIDGTSVSGAMYMWRCLRRVIDTGRVPLLDASFLASISPEEFAAIFTDDNGKNPLDTAMTERLANWHDLGRCLTDSWAGHFHNILEASNGSLVEFVKLSQSFRAFEDPLLKLTMVNAILHVGNGIAYFDSEPLPAIDYHIVKQLLRQGILVPCALVSEKLERQILLTASEAYELRRMALCASVELSKRTGLSGEILDNLWWWNRMHCRTDNPVCHSVATARQCPFVGACAKFTNLRMPLEDTRYY